MFKVGQKVIAIANGFNYGSNSTTEDCHNYAKGWTGEVTRVMSDGSIDVQFDNGRFIIECSGYNFEEATMEKFKVGQKVKILSGCYGDLAKYEGTTQEIASVKDGKYYMNDLPKCMPDGTLCYWRETEIELAEKTKVELEPVQEQLMTYTEALKAAIDGHKVQGKTWKDSYMYFKGNRFRLHGVSDGYDDGYNLGDAGEQWKLYEQPKVLPKFSIGSTVVYRSNRHATIVKVSDSVPYVYTLNADPEKPNCTFEKSEDELREAK